MKNYTFVLISYLILSIGCNNDKDSPIDPTDNTVKGLISFKTIPEFNDPNIEFKAQIQFNAKGGPANIEYHVYDGSQLLYNGIALASLNPDGMRLFYETELIGVAIDSLAHTGKTLTVWLDPENKITASDYTNANSVELWKKEDVLIP